MNEYPYEKSILLNAVYDALERLDCPLAYADSRAGRLDFSYGENVGKMDLTSIHRGEDEITRVEITDTGQELIDVLYDEIGAVLHRSLEFAARRNER